MTALTHLASRFRSRSAHCPADAAPPSAVASTDLVEAIRGYAFALYAGAVMLGGAWALPVAAAEAPGTAATAPKKACCAAAKPGAHAASEDSSGRADTRGQGLHAAEFPDLELIDQDGHTQRFYSDVLQGHVVAMNFVFTTCRTICPPMGATFGQLQTVLGERLGERFGTDVRLVSVSIDPVNDTPQRLKAWGRQFGAGPAWTLLTGHKSDVDKVLKKLQVFTPDYEDHAPILLVGNETTGVWRRANGLAPPEQIAALVDEVLKAPPADTGAPSARHAGPDHDAAGTDATATPHPGEAP